MYPIVLDEQQRKRLSDAFKTSDDPRLRLRSQAVLLASRSHPTEQIAQDLGVSVRTVRRWLCAFVQRGLAQMVPPWGPGRPAKIPESEADRIKQWVVDGPWPAVACGPTGPIPSWPRTSTRNWAFPSAAALCATSAISMAFVPTVLPTVTFAATRPSSKPPRSSWRR